MSANPIYKNLAKELQEQLLRNPPPSGSRFYSARELVNLHHISFLTANKVLDYLASEGIIYRMRGSGSYFRDPSAGMRVTYCGHKQYIMGSGYEQNMQKIFEDGLWEDLKKKGHSLNFYDIPDDTEWNIPQKLLKETDVILTMNGYITPEVELYLRKIGKPVIVRGESFVGPWPFHQIVNSLDPALHEFFRDFSGLLEKPVKILSTGYPDTLSRAEVFMREAELITSGKIAMEREELVLPPNDGGRLCGYQYGMENGENLRGCLVMVTSDFIAAGLMEALDRKNMAAGKDYWLLGYDNLEERGYTVFDHPRISSIGYDVKQCALQMHKLIMQAVNNEDRTIYTYHLPTSLSVRESLSGK